MEDLFGNTATQDPELPPGIVLYRRYFTLSQQNALLEAISAVLMSAPLFRPLMPGTGQPFSVRMSNCGDLGWVSDRAGYRYQSFHPDTREPFPPMPPQLVDLWHTVAPGAPRPQACLINQYEPTARMGLHQDRDEADFSVPVVSVSLGDDCRFRIGGLKRGGKTQSLILQSGDVLVLGGENRLCFHGVDRIISGTAPAGLSLNSQGQGGRVNLTLRRVTRP